MNYFRIESRDGDVYGIWRGADATAALCAMFDDAGDVYGSETAGTEESWRVLPIDGPLAKAIAGLPDPYGSAVMFAVACNEFPSDDTTVYVFDDNSILYDWVLDCFGIDCNDPEDVAAFRSAVGPSASAEFRQYLESL